MLNVSNVKCNLSQDMVCVNYYFKIHFFYAYEPLSSYCFCCGSYYYYSAASNAI